MHTHTHVTCTHTQTFYLSLTHTRTYTMVHASTHMHTNFYTHTHTLSLVHTHTHRHTFQKDELRLHRLRIRTPMIRSKVWEWTFNRFLSFCFLFSFSSFLSLYPKPEWVSQNTRHNNVFLILLHIFFFLSFFWVSEKSTSIQSQQCKLRVRKQCQQREDLSQAFVLLCHGVVICEGTGVLYLSPLLARPCQELHAVCLQRECSTNSHGSAWELQCTTTLSLCL